ncbi:hypothetical protein GUJ93_ZPchr0001g32856 [Zizania palustris]|uniref:Uncharacterized protein n=1 Tax=Zizania palustris TaxID=103762 RepID=A0A8J5RR71_ZIZPA|nr:hypothetical protein GUJ93_ZPchr0001g32856 [Zizania palustris]
MGGALEAWSTGCPGGSGGQRQAQAAASSDTTSPSSRRPESRDESLKPAAWESEVSYLAASRRSEAQRRQTALQRPVVDRRRVLMHRDGSRTGGGTKYHLGLGHDVRSWEKSL